MSSPSATRPPRLAPAVHAETDYATLADRFRPIFDRIRTGVIEREQSRVLPFEQIAWLKEAGFGALRVPISADGFGATIPQLFGLLTELSVADSNVTQALRAHFAFVEDRLVSPAGPQRDVWLRRFANGELVGGAWTEIGEVPIGEVLTKVSPSTRAGTFLVNGQKYYSTGSIFADWIDVYAQRTDTGEFVIAAVNAHEPGVSQRDDWDGFGQQTTGSGTSTYRDVPISEENLIPFDTRFRYQTAFYQLFHLVTLAGIARAATEEVTARVAARTRIFSHGNASSFAADPQIQQVVGELSSAAFAAEAIAQHAAEDVQWAYETATAGAADEDGAEEDRLANIRAEISTGQGQVVLSRLVIGATGSLFDALGASGVSKKWDLDRFWRNARTVASHNPWVFKAKVIGDYEINGTEPVYVWAIGAGAKK